MSSRRLQSTRAVTPLGRRAVWEQASAEAKWSGHRAGRPLVSVTGPRLRSHTMGHAHVDVSRLGDMAIGPRAETQAGRPRFAKHGAIAARAREPNSTSGSQEISPLDHCRGHFAPRQDGISSMLGVAYTLT